MARILDEAGDQILDERGYILLDEQPDTPTPGTTTATVWRATNGLSDFGSTSPSNIVDTLGDFLVDSLGIFVVDTGIINTLIPPTVWEEDNTV